jgi:hypothetical protein
LLYDATQTYTNQVVEHLQSLAALPDTDVYFVHTRPETTLPVALDTFDAVVIHYSVRVAFDGIGAGDARRLARFRGLKCLFIQDEYDRTEMARRAIDRLGLHVVFTCVAADRRERIYPSSRLPGVTFVSNLTGYAPSHLDTLPAPRLSERPIAIGYRGRRLPFWYGRLGQDKRIIGERMRAICDARGITTDISCDDAARIYGDEWYEFLGRCRSTLATESGSNVFDDDGSIRRRVEARLAGDPEASFENVFRDCLADVEEPGLMNQVSPRIFEAIACRTALVLFEGAYSGVVRPDDHYLPLRKDFANVDDVLAALADDATITRMTTRAYDDVIASGTYSYEAFTRMVAATIASECETRAHLIRPADRDDGGTIARAVARGRLTTAPVRAMPPAPYIGHPTAQPTGAAGRLRAVLLPIWSVTPEAARARIRPAARALLRAFESGRP